MILSKPLILIDIEGCVAHKTTIKGVDMKNYILGAYDLPMVIYSDSGNYGENENYLHSPVTKLSKSRLEEIFKALAVEPTIRLTMRQLILDMMAKGDKLVDLTHKELARLAKADNDNTPIGWTIEVNEEIENRLV